MNWKRGFRRIALVLSIVSAAAVAVTAAWLSYDHAKMSLFFAERDIESARDATCDAKEIDSLISFWRNLPSLSLNRGKQWKEWTGFELGQGPAWLNDPVAGESEERRKARLEERTRRLDLLKEQGWRTAGGDALPWTPEEVRSVWQMNRIKKLESRVRRCRNTVESVAIKEASIGGLCGFVAIWVLYVVAYPAVVWIGQGLRDDPRREQKQSTRSEANRADSARARE